MIFPFDFGLLWNAKPIPPGLANKITSAISAPQGKLFISHSQYGLVIIPARMIGKRDDHIEGISDDIDGARGRFFRKQGEIFIIGCAGVMHLHKQNFPDLFREVRANLRPEPVDLIRSQVGCLNPRLIVKNASLQSP
jgi:hypothetical protein